jgi:hypothetical protein
LRASRFGCGAAGFLRLAQIHATEVTGIELEARVKKYWLGELNISSSIIIVVGVYFDLIAAFHVVEHLQGPRPMPNCLV